MSSEFVWSPDLCEVCSCSASKGSGFGVGLVHLVGGRTGGADVRKVAGRKNLGSTLIEEM